MNFIIGVKHKTNSNVEKLFKKLHTKKGCSQVKNLERIALKTRPKLEEHMLIVLNYYTQEKKFSQTLQINSKQGESAVNFLTGYNSIFNVPKKQKILFRNIDYW